VTQTDQCARPASELAELIRTRQASPVEVVEHSLARIADVQPVLNAFAFTYPEEFKLSEYATHVPGSAVMAPKARGHRGKASVQAGPFSGCDG
jgi:Asp-tRNA(Asn)/Glu-tRNA(Gln) amidotransferase A subunit family amidase